MNKRKVVFLFASVIITILPTIVAFSHYGFQVDFRQGSENVINFLVNVFEPFLIFLFGGYDYSGLLIFEKFLIFLLIASMVFISLKQINVFDEQRKILALLSIIVPLLAVRFINIVWINTILIQYQLLGIALTAILPFIVYLFFLQSFDSSVIRKIGWIFFIMVYFGLWATTQTPNYAQLYFWTMIVAFLFLLLDGTIHQALARARLRESGHNSAYAAIADIENRMNLIRQSENIPERVKQRLLRRHKREIEWWQKNL
jgi:hypothetical protein